MRISHPERGGNGESRRVVTQWLRWRSVDLRDRRLELKPQSAARSHGLARFPTHLLRQNISQLRFSIFPRNPFDCATRQSFCPGGAQRTFAMIETVTAFLGLMSAGIFLAHAFDSFRSRA
jgi:hypothetical protein